MEPRMPCLSSREGDDDAISGNTRAKPG